MLFTNNIVIPDTLSISPIPDGKVAISDDVQTWLNCAIIFNLNYTTVAEVLADTETLSRLIENNNAVDYLVRSTSFANEVCASSVAMGYIGNDNYCAGSLLSDSTWREKICTSTYFESVLNCKVPTMTSNTSPSGVAFASTQYDTTTTYAAYRAFDGNNSTFWESEYRKNVGEYIGYDFGSDVTIYRVDINKHSNEHPKEFDLQYSSDNTSYTTSTTITTYSNVGDIPKGYTTNPQTGRYWRIYYKSIYGGNYAEASTLQFYGRRPTV